MLKNKGGGEFQWSEIKTSQRTNYLHRILRAHFQRYGDIAIATISLELHLEPEKRRERLHIAVTPCDNYFVFYNQHYNLILGLNTIKPFLALHYCNFCCRTNIKYICMLNMSLNYLLNILYRIATLVRTYTFCNQLIPTFKLFRFLKHSLSLHVFSKYFMFS